MDKEVFWNNTTIQRTSTMEEIFDFFNSNIDALIITNELLIPPISYFVAKGEEKRYAEFISNPIVRRNIGWMVSAIFKELGYSSFNKVRVPVRLHPIYFKYGSIYTMTNKEAKELIKEAYGNSEYTDEIIKALEQQKMGYWIDDCPMMTDEGLVRVIRCSCCNEQRKDYYGVRKNYCPNCGAKMESEG